METEYEKAKAEMVESLKNATIPEEDREEEPEDGIKTDFEDDWEAAQKTCSPSEALAVLRMISQNMIDIFEEDWAKYDDWTEREIRFLEGILESMDFCIQSLKDWIGINRIRLKALHKEED